ncbi:hypothetical protein B0H19DRAFT_1120541 [Mycena capillaripes]|nr:hypothetical protein B0H19DRAFT_1120541 [Mycena capillaripes]
MENDAPAPDNDVLARLRASELKSVELEGQIAVLRLKNAHKLEDMATAQSERNAYRARCHRAERELTELRAKYEGLKRRVPPNLLKRKHEDGGDDVERPERVSRGEESPEVSPQVAVRELPDAHSNLGEPISRKSSASSSTSTDERNNPWLRSPVVVSPSLPAMLSSTSDPRKRMKLDMRSPSTAPVAPRNSSPPSPLVSASRPTSTPTPSFSAPNFTTPDYNRTGRPPPPQSSESKAGSSPVNPKNLGYQYNQGRWPGMHPPVR